MPQFIFGLTCGLIILACYLRCHINQWNKVIEDMQRLTKFYELKLEYECERAYLLGKAAGVKEKSDSDSKNKFKTNPANRLIQK